MVAARRRRFRRRRMVGIAPGITAERHTRTGSRQLWRQHPLKYTSRLRPERFKIDPHQTRLPKSHHLPRRAEQPRNSMRKQRLVAGEQHGHFFGVRADLGPNTRRRRIRRERLGAQNTSFIAKLARGDLRRFQGSLQRTRNDQRRPHFGRMRPLQNAHELFAAFLRQPAIRIAARRRPVLGDCVAKKIQLQTTLPIS